MALIQGSLTSLRHALSTRCHQILPDGLPAAALVELLPEIFDLLFQSRMSGPGIFQRLFFLMSRSI